MRVKTKSDVMKLAHEITAPTFAEALASAWAETSEIERDYAREVSKLRHDLYYIKRNDNGKLKKFADQKSVAELFKKTLVHRGFPGQLVSSKHNLQTFRLSPLEVLEVNTFDHGKFFTIFAVSVRKG